MTGPWDPRSAGDEFQAILPAAAWAARQGRPLAAAWLCRGAGWPLELITNAVMPAPASGGPAAGGPAAPLFPPGARGAAAWPGWRDRLATLVWATCSGRQAPPLAGDPPAAEKAGGSA